jgi:hypothetical protein
MTDLEILEGNIGELKERLSDAWRQLARYSLTKFDHRELRREMKRCDAELRFCLGLIEVMRARSRTAVSLEVASPKLTASDFRLLGQNQRDLGLRLVSAEEAAN